MAKNFLNKELSTLKCTQGSTLTWVMVVSLVLTLLIAAILAIISFNSHTTMLDRTKTQAYYTAQSVNERIATWLTGTPSPGTYDVNDVNQENYGDVIEPYRFVEDLKNGPITQTYSEAQLGESMGSAVTTVQFTDDAETEITITTTATYADVEETLSTRMYIKQISSFNSVNTEFTYDAPDVSAALAEIAQLETWESQAEWAKQTSASTAYNASSPWWTSFLNEYNVVDYRMDLLAVSPADYRSQPAELRHDYSFKFLQNRSFSSGNKTAAHINLDPSRGAFYVNQTNAANSADIPGIDISDTSTDNPIITGQFPYNNTSLRSTVKGVFLAVDPNSNTNVTNSVAHDKLVYYTKDHEGFDKDNWPNLTLGSYTNTGSPTASLTNYKNLSLYITDTSEKSFEINSGLTIESGTLYTKRNTAIGTVFDETGSGVNTQMNTYTKNTHLTFSSYNFIFADPGLEEDTRYSSITGTAYAGGTSQTRVQGGSILVQANHELTIGTGANIDVSNSKGIVIEPGGSLILEGNANIIGNIYVANGASLSINGFVYITGNIFCSGIMNINNSFVLMTLDSNADNQYYGYVSNNPDPKLGNCTGIFIYNDVTIGAGELNVAPNQIIDSPTYPESNKIHSFIPYPTYLPSLFCSHANQTTHVCEAWLTNESVWMPRPGSTEEVFE